MEKLSEPKRMLYVFTKPGAAMADIGANPRVLVPIMCMIVVPILSVVVNMSYYHDAIVTQSLALGLSPELVYSMAQTQMYALLVSMPLQALIMWLVFSLAAYGLGQIFEGDGEITYKTVLSITGYAFFVKAFYYIAQTINIAVYPDRLLTFSVHDLVSLAVQPANLYLTLILQNLSVFKIWEYALVGVGIYKCKQTSKTKAVLVPVILFIVQLVIVCVQVAVTANMNPALMAQ